MADARKATEEAIAKEAAAADAMREAEARGGALGLSPRPKYPMGFDFGDFFGSCYLSFCGISWDFMGFHGGSKMGLNGICLLVNAATELYGTDPHHVMI